MRRHAIGFLIVVLCSGLLSSYSTEKKQAPAQAKKAPEAKITVLSPMGMPPAYALRPMAQRPSSLDGKTIYIVDDGFVGGDNLLKEFVSWFGRNMPKVNVVFKRKAGSFQAEDPALWAEIKEKGDAMIMGMGH